MAQRDSLCLANSEKMHHVQIDNPDFFEIKHDCLRSTVGSQLQVLHVLRFDPAAEPEDHLLSIRDRLNFQHGVRNPFWAQCKSDARCK